MYFSKSISSFQTEKNVDTWGTHVFAVATGAQITVVDINSILYRNFGFSYDIDDETGTGILFYSIVIR